jgi:hypothetical protein
VIAFESCFFLCTTNFLEFLFILVSAELNTKASINFVEQMKYNVCICVCVYLHGMKVRCQKEKLIMIGFLENGVRSTIDDVFFIFFLISTWITADF